MIAVARTIADRRDTLALGALLRGPLVGLTEEEIADAIIALPRYRRGPNSAPCISGRIARPLPIPSSSTHLKCCKISLEGRAKRRPIT